MKGIIEQEIEKYADRTGEYPKIVAVTEKEYEILIKELEKEYLDVGRNIGVIDEFRGCKLVRDKKITRFEVK